MSRIAVTCDCTCDLSDDLRLKFGLSQVYCHVITDRGRFCDPLEITARNIFEYMSDGGRPITESPVVEDYIELFKMKFKNYDEIIHVTTGSSISSSYNHGLEAAKLMGVSDKVHMVDSGSLSTGAGHVAIRAANLVRRDLSSDEILKDLEEFKKRISCSFIVKDLDYIGMVELR